MRMLAQRRAKYALEKVLALGNSLNSEFKSFAAGVPSIILQNGFGQAMAFILAKSKGEDKHKRIFDIIREWFNKDENPFKFPSNSDSEFLKKISECSQQKYLELQQETMDLLEWVKRYAGAFVKDKD